MAVVKQFGAKELLESRTSYLRRQMAHNTHVMWTTRCFTGLLTRLCKETLRINDLLAHEVSNK